MIPLLTFFLVLVACIPLILWRPRVPAERRPYRPLTPTEALEQYEELFARPLTDQEKEHFLRGYRLGFQQGVSS